MLAAINEKFTGQVAAGNAAAARAAFDFVRDERKALNLEETRALEEARADA